MAREQAAAAVTGNVADMSPQALRELLENLRVHQIELELQNTELRRTQVALETARSAISIFTTRLPWVMSR